ncbi:hypothetical protein ACQ4PT_037446 [Festuca glaucescens]
MDTGEQAAEESSANRRERLLALRSAAAATGSSSSSPSAAPPPLPPPAWDLPEPDLTPSSAPRPPARFGFYTNPGAAFSSAAAPHKRKNPDTLLGPSPAPAPPHAGSGNYGNNYPPPHQHHMAPSQMEPAPPGTSQWKSPMQFQTPMSEYGGVPPGPPPHWNPHSTSPAQGYYPRSPNFGFRGSNIGRGGNPMNCGPRGSPVNYGPRGSPTNYEPRGSPMNYGPRGSPCSSSGRGRGENYYSGPGSRGRGGRGGSGFQNHSGGQGQMNYYKSMVDDPWKNLRPIVGSILPIGGGGAKSWFQESLRTKKDNIPDQGRVISTSTSGLSLAEYLDLSFNEVSNET